MPSFSENSASRPIVWFHKGPCWYLPWAIIQAQTSNLHNPQIALTDVPIAMPGVEWVDLNTYWDEAAAFEKIYRHESVLPSSFELPSIQKWFVLNEWMQTNNVAQCFFVDSDVMIYGNINEDSPRFNGADLTYLPDGGPANGYINNREALNRFCQFIMKIYTHPELLYKNLNEARLMVPTLNVNDMSLFHWFRQQDALLKSANLCETDNNMAGASEHDRSLQFVEGWKSKGREKKIIWRHGFPYAIRENGENVRMLTLHFIGTTKRLMPAHCTAPRRQRFRLLPAFWPVAAFHVLRRVYRWAKPRMPRKA